MSCTPPPGDPGDPGEPAWLSPRERASWVALGALIVKLPSALDSQLATDESLSFFEYMVLAVLSEQPDRTLQMSDIADATSASLSRLSHTAKRLEDQGFLQRTRLPGSGRRTSATLTEAGYAKVVAAAPGHVRRVRELVVDAMTADELETMRAIASRILHRIDPQLPGGLWPSIEIDVPETVEPDTMGP